MAAPSSENSAKTIVLEVNLLFDMLFSISCHNPAGFEFVEGNEIIENLPRDPSRSKTRVRDINRCEFTIYYFGKELSN